MVIRFYCYANGSPSPHDGRFLKDVRWDINDLGEAEIESTEDRAEAIQFDGLGEATKFWQTQSHVCPLRPWDQQPNRPLTAYCVTTEK